MITRVHVYCKPGAVIPQYQSEYASGMDLVANEDAGFLAPGQWKLVSTGIHIAIPAGFEGQVRPRSGWAAKHGITVTNSPGTIDSDYRGEVKVILQNTGNVPFPVKKGDRIAQLVIVPVAKAIISPVNTLEELGNTGRGEGGFGSTGMSSPTEVTQEM